MDMNSQQIQDKARELTDRVGPQLEQARANLSDFNQRAVGFIRKNPGTCLLGALAFGFVVGKIASRR